MRITRKSRALAIGVATAALVGGVAATAAAEPQANGSDAAIYLYNGGDGSPLDTPGYSYAWNESVIVSGSPSDPLDELECPTETTAAYTFITDVGTERGGTDEWKVWAPNGLTVTHGINAANISPTQQINGEGPAVHSAGGTYSIGIACTTSNGVNVAAAYYRVATFEPVTGSWVVDRPDGEDGGDPDPEPEPGTTGQIPLTPSVVEAQEGVLSLNVPAGTVANFGEPTLVDNRSTTTGTLSNAVVVSDQRFTSREGWHLDANVAEFARQGDATDTIPASQLGLKPAVLTEGTTSTGAVAGPEQIAGSASYTSVFASAPEGQGIGDTALNANLTFVAPQGKAAGVYESVMTLTVVSE